ncbi:MAG: hypothetical protein NC218_08330 [Acetobacter sp.]|nr:hypothetical protein [Acetobacter sp.]
MVRNFRGQVKVSEIQEEFDNLTNGIQNLIDTYNNAVENVDTVDYTKGGTTLAPTGYTLSIGGLKEILKTYNGAILGSEMYKIGDDTYYANDGLYIKDNKVTRLKGGLVQGNGDILYYDLTNEKYTFGDKYVASQEGGVTIVTKDWVQPALTSNTSWGNITSEGPLGYTAWDGDNPGKEFSLFNSSTWIAVLQTRPKDFNEDIIWEFQTPLKLASISLSAMGFCTYNLDEAGHNPVVLQILDSSTKAVLASRNLTSNVVNYTISLDNDNTLNGIIIRLKFTGDASIRNFSIGKIKLTANSIQTIDIPNVSTADVDKDNLIKISNLNTNRITKLCNSPNFVVEDIPGFKLSTTSKLVNYGDGSVSVLNNQDKGQFVSIFREPVSGTRAYSTLFGENIVGGWRTEYNNAAYFGPLTRLFIPKSLSNPFGNISWQVVTDYNVTRQKFTQT